jgi:hypothetical protein
MRQNDEVVKVKVAVGITRQICIEARHFSLLDVKWITILVDPFEAQAHVDCTQHRGGLKLCSTLKMVFK